MKKSKVQHICGACGYTSAKWLGKCPDCNAWNSFESMKVEPEREDGGIRPSLKSAPVSFSDITAEENVVRDRSGISEVDRCLGGGLGRGSLILIGGEPGIGKSTLMLQILVGLLSENPKARALYVSGEESVNQVAQRAERIFSKAAKEIKDRLLFLSETCLETMETQFENMKPQFVVVDSIQTTYSSAVEGGSGSVAQIREVALKGLQWSKDKNHTVILVGHVTKDGNIAGPKLLEHMVDTVLYFEGESRTGLRLLRTVKNRFGTTSEIGVFEMGSQGLQELKEAGNLYRTLRQTQQNVIGSCLCCIMEGSRPFATEVQALVAAGGYGNGRRVASGVDSQRTAIVGAVLEKYLRLKLFDRDLFVSSVGGVRLSDPSADLAIAAALMSSALGQPITVSSAFIGEVTLTGEVRPGPQMESRLFELERLGMETVFTGSMSKNIYRGKMRIETVDHVKALHDRLWQGKAAKVRDERPADSPF